MLRDRGEKEREMREERRDKIRREKKRRVEESAL